MFDSIAGRYDLVNSLMTLGLDRTWRKFIVNQSELKTGGLALDVCCGTGRLTVELASSAAPAGRVVGLDFSENMLAVAAKYVKQFPFKENITLVHGDAAKLPFPADTFDCATVAWGLRNVPDISLVIKQMARVVKPGGKVVSLDMARPTVFVFKDLYWFALRTVIPALGRFLGRNKDAYEYLYSSARLFPPPEELAALFSETGLTETAYYNLCGGIVAVVEGRKRF